MAGKSLLGMAWRPQSKSWAPTGYAPMLIDSFADVISEGCGAGYSSMLDQRHTPFLGRLEQ